MSDEKKIEPTMSEPVATESAPESSHEKTETSTNQEAVTQESTNAGLHRIEPDSTTATTQNKPKATEKLMSFLPVKHRRLFIAFFILLLIIILYVWLSPSSEPKNAPTAQTETALPVEFQLINEQDQQQLQTQANDSQIASDESVGAGDGVVAPQASSIVLDTQGDTINIDSTTPQEADNSQAVTVLTPVPGNSNAEATKPVTIEEPKMTESTQPAYEVVAQPETTTKPVVKPVVKPTVKPTAETKPTTTTQTKSTKDVALTMQKGVSLMQLFRNNKLNISDVNAMSKTSGANRVFSRLQPGEQIILQLNKQNRVERMIMQDGKVFTRQSNGSYSLR